MLHSMKIQVFAALFLISIYTLKVSGLVKFTNIKCKNLDVDFCEFYICKLGATNRRLFTFSAAVHMYQVPVTNVSVRFRFMRKSNGYKPFMYDFTVDGCKFLRGVNNGRNHPIVSYIYDMALKYSNMNHTCPYDHDLMINNLAFEDTPTFKMTFLAGEYAIYTTWITYNKPRADMNVYFTIS